MWLMSNAILDLLIYKSAYTGDTSNPNYHLKHCASQFSYHTSEMLLVSIIVSNIVQANIDTQSRTVRAMSSVSRRFKLHASSIGIQTPIIKPRASRHSNHHRSKYQRKPPGSNPSRMLSALEPERPTNVLAKTYAVPPCPSFLSRSPDPPRTSFKV